MNLALSVHETKFKISKNARENLQSRHLLHQKQEKLVNPSLVNCIDLDAESQSHVSPSAAFVLAFRLSDPDIINHSKI